MADDFRSRLPQDNNQQNDPQTSSGGSFGASSEGGNTEPPRPSQSRPTPPPIPPRTSREPSATPAPPPPPPASLPISEPEVSSSQPPTPPAPEPPPEAPAPSPVTEGYAGSEVPPKNDPLRIRTMADDLGAAGTNQAAQEEKTITPQQFETGEPVFKPETVNQMDGPVEELEHHGGKKKLFLFIIIGLVIVGVGAASYLFLFPILFPDPVDVTPEPIVQEQPVVEEPVVEEPGPEVTAPPASLFSKEANERTEIDLPNFSLSGIRAAITEAADQKLANGQVKELLFKNAGVPVAFGEYIDKFSKPAIDQPAPPFLNLGDFEDNFTAFIYYDDKGAWPGYVARLTDAASEESLRMRMKAIEEANSLALTDFYPKKLDGSFGEFKDGQANDIPTRYTIEENGGDAAFNYMVANHSLILSTSYNGLKAALVLLDFDILEF